MNSFVSLHVVVRALRQWARSGAARLFAAVVSAAMALFLGSPAGFAVQQAPGGGPQAEPVERVTFTETIAPIVYANCVTCHRQGEAAPFPLLTYEDVARRGALIARVTESRYMPPWHAEAGAGEFVGERRLTDWQIQAIGAWVQQGMPRGDEATMPPPPRFPADGWQLGQPDLVLEMPVGFEVPASGPDVFRNFVIPTRLTDDKWVRGVEFRPGARNVVHHAIFAAVPGGSMAALDGADGRPGFGGLSAVGIINTQGDSRGLGGWAVGATPMPFPDGLATRLPKGSDFLLQLHLHPSGKPETEKSLIGIYFTDEPPAKTIVTVSLPELFGFGFGLDIPAGETSYAMTDSFTLPGDVKVYSVMPHAHYLAKQMRVTAALPDGSTKTLIAIHDWDFNWQDSYVYKQPVVLPKGTRLDATITYDNSAGNPRNPLNPPRRTLWGEQSLDEMGGIGFTVEVLDEADVPAVRQALAARVKTTIAAANKNGTLARYLARNKRDRGPRQQLTVFDRSGAIVARIGEPGLYSFPAFSPDGNRIAVIRTDVETGYQDVWTFDIATGRGRAITADAAMDSFPVWSADGGSIAYSSVRDNTHHVFRRAADGSGPEEHLYEHDTGNAVILTDWSRDGRFFTFWSGQGMFVLPVGERKAVQIEEGRGGRFSPDGRLFAYNGLEGNQPGRFQVFLRPFDGAATPGPSVVRQKVSADNAIGGIAWRRDGGEMYFLSQPPNQRMMAVELTSAGAVPAPRPLFEVPPGIGPPAQLSTINSPDGQRFVFAVNLPQRTTDTRR